jgi:hypothetical protein
MPAAAGGRGVHCVASGWVLGRTACGPARRAPPRPALGAQVLLFAVRKGRAGLTPLPSARRGGAAVAAAGRAPAGTVRARGRRRAGRRGAGGAHCLCPAPLSTGHGVFKSSKNPAPATTALGAITAAPSLPHRRSFQPGRQRGAIAAAPGDRTAAGGGLGPRRGAGGGATDAGRARRRRSGARRSGAGRLRPPWRRPRRCCRTRCSRCARGVGGPGPRAGARPAPACGRAPRAPLLWAPPQPQPPHPTPRPRRRPDPQNVGRHLPLAGMRTCRLVCKRWAAVIGESVTAVGVSADLLRTAVLGDPLPGGRGGGGGGGGADDDGALDVDSGSDGGSGDEGAGSGGGGGPAPPRGARAAAAARAMRRLRRLSRQLARAFPRAHTVVIHIDIGWAGRGGGRGEEVAGRGGCQHRVTAGRGPAAAGLAPDLPARALGPSQGTATTRRRSPTTARRGCRRCWAACPTWRASGAGARGRGPGTRARCHGTVRGLQQHRHRAHLRRPALTRRPRALPPQAGDEGAGRGRPGDCGARGAGGRRGGALLRAARALDMAAVGGRSASP